MSKLAWIVVVSALTAPVVPAAAETAIPDLRGTWTVVDAFTGEGPLSAEHPIWHHVERIEQAGHRAVVTADGIIHDMVADGSYENGVNDVMEMNLSQKISVAARFREGRLELHRGGIHDGRPALVTREIVDGEFFAHRFSEIRRPPAGRDGASRRSRRRSAARS